MRTIHATVLLILLVATITDPSTIAAGVAPRASGQVTDYRIGPGDMLSIQVSGLREFNQSARVANSGRIRVPYVGIMFVAGKTAFEIEREIARAIAAQQLINEPSVRVHVEQFRAQPTYVIGEVNAPGQFMVTGEMYLLDLLSKAGGLRLSADATAYLYRRNSPRPEVSTRLMMDPAATKPADAAVADPASGGASSPAWTEEVIKIDLQALREGTSPELNLRLEGGDILYVPRVRPDNIYIIGDVRIPGAYTLPRRGEITAAQAVIYAGGPLATAKMSNGFLMRHDEAGVRQAIPVDFSAILNGRRPDVPVQPNDIIFIPNSSVRTIGVGLVNLVPRLIQQFLIF